MNKEQTRAQEHGPMGQYLLGELGKVPHSDFYGLSLDGQISYVYRPTWHGSRPTRIQRAALSYLGGEYVIQVPLEEFDINHLVCHLSSGYELQFKESVPEWMLNYESVRKRVKFKPSVASFVKANVFLDDLMRDLVRKDAAYACQAATYVAAGAEEGMTNDQLTAMVLYSSGIRGVIRSALPWAYLCVSDPSLAKEVSSFIKAVGANGSRAGALVAEANTLVGRGVGGFDAFGAAALRCDQEWVSSQVAEYPEDQLRSAVCAILRLELRHNERGGTALSFGTTQELWDSRWRWAVNGAHTKKAEDNFTDPVQVPEELFKVHRRAALEMHAQNPLDTWDGTTYVSTSPKEEHGKTRAIYACDTVNYIAFQHLMSAVEKSWRGVRVVLDPGRGGTYGMAERVRACRNRSGVSMMLDYDDFNSHHSTRAMQILISETCRLTGYPPDLADRLVRSFEKEELWCEGKRVGMCAGTLMSGHRCTTFINSVLNMAYLMCELGEKYIMERTSIHVGDDVYLGVASYKDAAHVADTLKDSQLRMNRSKQSVGHVSTEFLRLATGAEGSFGYYARSVASVVSGNWVTDRVLEPDEFLVNIVASARSLINRSGSEMPALLLTSAVSRVIGKGGLDDGTLGELLTGSIALNDGPQFKSSGSHRRITLSVVRPEPAPLSKGTLPAVATNDYLIKCTSEVERSILERSGISVKSDMIVSSYSKSMRYTANKVSKLVFSPIIRSPARGSETMEDVARRRVRGGVLLRYPLLVLAKGRLKGVLLREAVSLAGGDSNAQDIEFEAWGDKGRSTIIDGVLPYSDAAAYGKRAVTSVLACRHKCYM